MGMSITGCLIELWVTLIDAATPDMAFEELYYFMNDLSVKKDF